MTNDSPIEFPDSSGHVSQPMPSELDDFQADVAAIHEGMDDFANGRYEPLAQAMREIRAQLGLPSHCT
jgi:hypothetical protein